MSRFDSNIDDFQRKLQQIRNNVEALGGTREVTFSELFNASFMSRYTDYGTFDEMLQSSGFQVETQADFEQIPDDAWNEFVAAHTRFPNWQEMLSTAGQEYYAKKLNEALHS